jgi:hypothetical protein
MDGRGPLGELAGPWKRRPSDDTAWHGPAAPASNDERWKEGKEGMGRGHLIRPEEARGRRF